MKNIAEILKGYARGTKLYTPIYGEVEFYCIYDDEIITLTKAGHTLTFTHEGKLRVSDTTDAECILFPSKECRDWSKFHKSQILK